MGDTSTTTVASMNTTSSVLIRMATRYGVDPAKLHTTLKATAFKGDVSNEQMMALMIVADQYKLNPLLREIFAFPDKGGIVPVVSIDGWVRIVNEHPQFDGSAFVDGPDDKNGLPAWIECTIYRKDRAHPIITREYMAECKRSTGPWGSHPRRMLRHKSFIQCARMAFGFAGIYDHDEAERIVEGERVLQESPTIAKINALMRDKVEETPTPEIVDPVVPPDAAADTPPQP